MSSPPHHLQIAADIAPRDDLATDDKEIAGAVVVDRNLAAHHRDVAIDVAFGANVAARGQYIARDAVADPQIAAHHQKIAVDRCIDVHLPTHCRDVTVDRSADCDPAGTFEQVFVKGSRSRDLSFKILGLPVRRNQQQCGNSSGRQ